MINVKQEKSTGQPHRWKPGESGNLKGRPPVPEIEELRQAIRIARKKRGNRSILVHFVERAYVNDQVLIALAKKLIPDKVSGEFKGEGLGDTNIIILNGSRPNGESLIDRIKNNSKTISREIP